MAKLKLMFLILPFFKIMSTQYINFQRQTPIDGVSAGIELFLYPEPFLRYSSNFLAFGILFAR